MYDRKLLFFSLAFQRTKVQFIQAQRARSRRTLKTAFADNVLPVTAGKVLFRSESEIRNAIVLRGALLELIL